MVWPKWILPVAIIGAGLVYLSVASHEPGAAALIGRARSTPIVKVTVPPGAESAHAAAGPSTMPAASPALPIAKFRFGFLEFEDDADASTR